MSLLDHMPHLIHLCAQHLRQSLSGYVLHEYLNEMLKAKLPLQIHFPRFHNIVDLSRMMTYNETHPIDSFISMVIDLKVAF